MTAQAPLSANRRRAAARLAGVQALYELDLTNASADAVIAAFLRDRWAESVGDPSIAPIEGGLFAEVVRAVTARQSALDLAINEALTHRLRVERLEVLLRAVLRAGAYELSADHETPASVIINEYLEIAHAFFGGKEPALVNAVLDRLARSMGRRDVGDTATPPPAGFGGSERGSGEQADVPGPLPVTGPDESRER